MENVKHKDHDHPYSPVMVNRAYIVGIAFNLIFVIIEVTAGLVVNSLSLLSDAGHNLADVVALALSLLAFRLMNVRPTDQYTYGFRKTSILVALFNTMFLLVSIGAIIFEAVHRLIVPQVTKGGIIAIVAAIGIFINGLTAFMFLRNKEEDINIKSAYLHLLSDALISVGIVAGGFIIYYTGWYWIDSLFSILVAVIILIGTWKLLVSSLRLSLDGVPANISMDDLRETALKIDGVLDFHHIHVWAISTTENALTAHIVISPDASGSQELALKKKLRDALNRRNISHITLETERGEEDCAKRGC
jgi:cobalt-zinc-cadmium efflux system protein